MVSFLEILFKGSKYRSDSVTFTKESPRLEQPPVDSRDSWMERPLKAQDSLILVVLLRIVSGS